MSLYVAAYDIAHTNRRTRVGRILLGYGRRVQRSVYEVWLEPEEVAPLLRRIGPLLDRHDCFDLYPIDDRGTRKRRRWQASPDDYLPVVLL